MSDENEFVDDIDRRLIEALRSDSRRSNTDIARELDISEATVRKRIARLVREGICHFRVFPNPYKFGYPHYLTIDAHVMPGMLNAVADAMAKIPELIFVGICLGVYDIRATALARSNEHVLDLMQRINSIAGLRQSQTSSVIRIVKREYAFPLSQDGQSQESTPPEE